ncbi:MAG: glycosyltransferase [Planctomycetota bacterium]
MAATLIVVDNKAAPPSDGESYPLYHQMVALSAASNLDVLFVQHPGAPVPAESDFPPGLRSLFVVPARLPASKIGRACSELFRGNPFFEVAATVTPNEWPGILQGRAYDLVYGYTARMGKVALEVARALPGTPRRALCIHDALTERCRFYRDIWPLVWYGPYNRLCYFRGLRRFYYGRVEGKLLSPFDLVIVQTATDRANVIADASAALDSRLVVATNGYRPELLNVAYNGARSQRLLMVGSLSVVLFGRVLWFIKQVFLPARRKLPELQLDMVGKISPEQRRTLSTFPGVNVVGFVPELSDAFRDRAMLVSPTFMRNGFLNKVLDAMTAGMPCSGIGAFNGFEGFQNGEHGFEVQSADQWVALLTEVLTQPERLEAVSRAGRMLVKDRFRWETTLQDFLRRMLPMEDGGAPPTAVRRP